jgi:hypothetical protein
MLRTGLVTALVMFALVGVHAGSRQRGQGAVSSVVPYDDFMKMSVDERHGRFGALSAENKALIVRTHAERWLVKNRTRLSASEVGVFQEMIDFIAPARYAKQPDTAMDRQEQALKAKMRCRVSPDDVVQAFNVFGASSQAGAARPTWTYLSQARCWLDVMADDLVDYVPTIRH